MRQQTKQRDSAPSGIFGSEFLSQMGQEIRTPLNVVTSLSQLLLEGAPGPVTGEQKKYIEVIGRNADAAMRLLNDFFDLSRMETGQLPLEVKPFDLQSVLNDTGVAFAPLADAKDLSVVVEPPVRPLPKVLADPDRVRQVVGNLLSNAIKFTDKGRVTVATELYDRSIAVHVWDTGIGIPAASIPMLFRDFYQVDPKGDRAPRGSGLGLAISKRLVVRMGGDIWVTSTVGQGSRFSFTVPRAPEKVPAGRGQGR